MVYYYPPRYKCIILLILLICLGSKASAQDRFTLKGTVRDAKTKELLNNATVRIDQNAEFITANREGEFTIERLHKGFYNLSVTHLGYITNEIAVQIESDTLLEILLQERIIGLNEVAVIAKAKTLGSSSVIEKSAIIHTQPTSLADVLQLIPGQLATNPNIGAAQQVNLRQITTTTDAERANALGTQIIMDGVPISNNANLQTDQTILNASPSALPPFSSVAGRGNDLRQIPVDNIESIEVIRGIPSARYGDLTSGLILVNSKIGKAKPEIRVRINPNLIQLAGNTGIVNKKKNHVINLGLDWLKARNDVRDRLNSYSRVQGQISSQLSLDAERKFVLTTIINGYKTLDALKQDPDDLRYQSRQYSDDYGLKFSHEGKWKADKPWLSQINYTMALTASYQKAFYQSLITRELFPISTAINDITMQGVYGKSEYLNKTTVDGKPVNGYARLEALWIKNLLTTRHRLIAGSEWRMDANYGLGRQFDILNPPRQNYSVGDRPRSYHDIPPLHQLAYYIEDRVTGYIKDKRFSAQLGGRLDNMAPGNLFQSKFKTLFLPRLNLAVEVQSNIWLRGGYGVAGKIPPLSYLYPGTKYFDLINFNYYAINPAERLVIITTRRIPLDGLKLDPYTSEKYELGLDIEKKHFSINASFFNETTRGAIGINREVKTFAYEKLQIENAPVGSPPVLSPVPLKVDTFYAAYDKPVNNRFIANKGLEFTINIPELKAIRTSFNITGAYIQTESYDDGYYTDAVRAYQGNTVPNRIGIYYSSARVKAQRFNTSIRFIHRLPSLNMVFSALVQTIWVSKSEPLNISPYPIAYMDKTGNVTPLSSEAALMPEYNDLVRTASTVYPTAYPPLHLLNIRLTKEWKQGFGFSFYANNFLNYRPSHYDANSRGLIRRNEPLFFGFEFNISVGKSSS